MSELTQREAAGYFTREDKKKIEALECRVKILCVALKNYQRTEEMFGHSGNHPDEKCADCARWRIADKALKNEY